MYLDVCIVAAFVNGGIEGGVRFPWNQILCSLTSASLLVLPWVGAVAQSIQSIVDWILWRTCHRDVSAGVCDV